MSRLLTLLLLYRAGYIVGKYISIEKLIEISEETQSYVTKGDANAVEDAEPVNFSRLIGKPVLCIPGIATVANFMNSQSGMRVIAFSFFIVLLLWLAADWLKKRECKSENG